MGIIKKIKRHARANKAKGLGYQYTEQVMLWKSKRCNWNWLALNYGIRRSDVNQYFPIWNMSNNSNKIICFGFMKWHISLYYSRKGSFNQYYMATRYSRGWFRRFLQLIM